MIKFTVGMEGVKTKNGHSVRILCVDAPGPYPIVGYAILEGEPDYCHYTWTKDGRFSEEGENDRDLVLPKQIRKVWLNIYDDRVVAHSSPGEAAGLAKQDCLKVAHLVEVEI